MKYRELLGIAVETHIDNQMYSGEIISVGSSGSSINQKYLFYLKYLFMAEKELYEEVSPCLSDSWSLRVFISEEQNVKFSSCDFKGTLFKIKSVSSIVDGKEKELSEIPRYEMAKYMALDKEGITLNGRVKESYCVNTGNSITVYSNTVPYKVLVIWLPSYWSLLNKKDEVSNVDTIKDKLSINEKNSKANADFNYDQFDKYLDYEVITPEQYHELLFNGLLVYLYRNNPTFQASTKEQLAWQLWEEGKKKAKNRAVYGKIFA